MNQDEKDLKFFGRPRQIIFIFIFEYFFFTDPPPIEAPDVPMYPYLSALLGRPAQVSNRHKSIKVECQSVIDSLLDKVDEINDNKSCVIMHRV